MCSWIHRAAVRSILVSLFIGLFPVISKAEIKTWTGYGGDTNWSNALNWSGSVIPASGDDVLLDNREMPLSYNVLLPVTQITLRTIRIEPSPGRNIELILPAANIQLNALTLTGPGYGIELNAGAIFRNASGLSSGESLFIADSIMIHDGGRYIHQTRAAHANNIVRLLSAAPGTEQGVFDFDVPRASYTISVSNRIYGSLELHAASFGSTVNYTCSGANPLTIRGNMRIGPGVNMTADLTGPNGNIQVSGDFIQEGGQLNLASGSGGHTVLKVKGDLYQMPMASITETNTGDPFIELNGSRLQEIAMSGRLINQVGFRLNNNAGSVLRLPLELPWRLELKEGALTTSTSSILTLDSGCLIQADSSVQTVTYINGPVKKMSLQNEEHFLFPVGKGGFLRWIELKSGKGDFTVEYFRQNPETIGSALGPGLSHISKLEYWIVSAEGGTGQQGKLELSFSSAQSGGVTDPAFLHVAQFESSQWRDAGQSGITGNYLQGSVLSDQTAFSSAYYTLASTIDLENPLPLTNLELRVNEISGKPDFHWKIETDEIPQRFELFEDKDYQHLLLACIQSVPAQKEYHWAATDPLTKGNHYYSIRMIDIHGKEYAGETVLIKSKDDPPAMYWFEGLRYGKNIGIAIQADIPDQWKYEVLSVEGSVLKKGNMLLVEGTNYIFFDLAPVSGSLFVFRALDSKGNSHSLTFVK
jgi:hypothetical protein